MTRPDPEDDEPDESDDEEMDVDCGQFLRGGHIMCSQAGTEYCDWWSER